MIVAERNIRTTAVRCRDGAHNAPSHAAHNLLMRLLATLVLAAIPLIAQPVRNGALPGPMPLLPTDNWWNTDITSAPVDPNSASFISFIGNSRGMHPDFGGDSGDPSAPIYGMPYVVVSGTQPLVSPAFDYDDESDFAAPGRPLGYPIPEEAKTQQK